MSSFNLSVAFFVARVTVKKGANAYLQDKRGNTAIMGAVLKIMQVQHYKNLHTSMVNLIYSIIKKKSTQ
ncbi:hypothetical protein [Aliivibrio sp. SR45-2]|uniref:hypothetical protein n=1 Tax=Aliivibrio sp. SR45-2 TaxID=2760931 RepID=UPI0015FC2967|nr:hypothetical protein [Aliivibrio sp. SR45-2]MBB1312852.1 hypothetical protein [Aliivibrio sp. SR45-2]